jgi:hypothetical protein
VSNLDYFVSEYIRTMLWAETDNSTESGGSPLDDNYTDEDLSPEAMTRIRQDCQNFLDRAGKLIEYAIPNLLHPHPCDSWGYAAHDFWLNRNGHGCGFWDGDWSVTSTDDPDLIADQLDKIAESFGECNVEVGDDGKLYLL